MLLYKTTQKAVTGILRTVFRARVTGLENFPATGPVIVASNHLSFLDSIIISAMMPRRVAFLAKAEYVNTPGPRGKMMKAFFEAVDIIPVNRSDRSESLKALDIALEKLQEGKVFGIYPEGTRSREQDEEENPYLAVDFNTGFRKTWKGRGDFFVLIV